METGKRRSPCICRSLFKSYYVVWKLRTDAPNIHPFIEFKSYYVVWKQA